MNWSGVAPLELLQKDLLALVSERRSGQIILADVGV
jgi:hypothetical protein